MSDDPSETNAPDDSVIDKTLTSQSRRAAGWNRWLVIAAVCVFVGMSVAIAVDLMGGGRLFELGKPKVVTWDMLATLDFETGEAGDDIKSRDGTVVRIPGYVVPLDDDAKELREFLLVPNAQACIHVPPPPPNLIVYVKLKRPISVKAVFNPSWVQGKLTITTTNSKYGNAGYLMEAEGLERYSF